MYVCTPKEAMRFHGTTAQMVVIYHVGTGNQTCISWKSS